MRDIRQGPRAKMEHVLAIVAPGQGAQTPGFLAPWLEDAHFASRLQELSDVVGLDLVHYGTEADAETIKDTAIAQPLLVAAGLLAVLGRVELLHALDDGRFHRRRSGLDEFALLLELGEKFLAGDPELLCELMDTELSGHFSPHLWSRTVPGGFVSRALAYCRLPLSVAVHR